jgi:hypothetical protein
MRRSLALLVAGAVLAGAPAAQAQKKKPPPPAAKGGECTHGQLLMGNPSFQGPEKPDPKGAPIKDGPPIQMRSLVMRGANIYSNDGSEIWVVDLRAGTMKRIAGDGGPDGHGKFTDGPCKDARFINIHGLASYPDGDLVAADYKAHAILKISDPDSESCKVTYLAGHNTPTTGEGKAGDEDGPGATAKLTSPQWPIVDEDGTVFFLERRTHKIKKIATDEKNTVSTLTTLFDNKDYGYNGMVFINGKIYVIGNTFTNALIFEVDPKTGETKPILDAQPKDFPSLDPSTAPTLSSITTDGKDLIVSGQGYIWRITTKGKITHIAGGGTKIEFPRDYDIANSHPAKKAVLRFRNGDASIMGTTTALAYQNGVLFWRGRSDSAYVMSFRCMN